MNEYLKGLLIGAGVNHHFFTSDDFEKYPWSIILEVLSQNWHKLEDDAKCAISESFYNFVEKELHKKTNLSEIK